MYNASELFIIKDVFEIYTQLKQNNECMFLLPVSSQGQQMIIRLRSLWSFCQIHLQCMTAGSSRMSLA